MVVTLVVGRYLMDHLRYRELQYLSGRAVDVYARWVFLRGLPSTIDKLPENGTYLLWVGPKRLDKVLLYIPGRRFQLDNDTFLKTLHPRGRIRSPAVR